MPYIVILNVRMPFKCFSSSMVCLDFYIKVNDRTRWKVESYWLKVIRLELLSNL